ncbi:MAG: hypothetical protein IKI58_10810, partial [Oscillospiraceae bacterium]|nr:hypothetical protein [Oscillospiraceae bacterium]
ALFSRNREFRCLRAATRGSASGLRDLFEKRSIKNFNDNPIEVSRQTDRRDVFSPVSVCRETRSAYYKSFDCGSLLTLTFFKSWRVFGWQRPLAAGFTPHSPALCVK